MKHLHIDQNMRWVFSKMKPIFIFALFITLAVCCLTPQALAGPAPIQTYFVPLPELQVQNSLNAVDTNNAIGNDMRTIISIAATGDNTIFYYDHWEDGYEADMANPVQADTEIWGDNNPANGIPPGFATDLINAGDIITLDNIVSLPRNPALIRYDGRDKFGGTKAVAVTRASWAVSPGVVLAGAVEVYPLRDYGLQFEVPVGEDLASDQMFQYVSLIVMAAADGTDIQIDIDGDGSTDISQTLNQGESYQVDGGIDTGASVIASNPVQAHIFTGDIGARYESRFYTLYPVDNWSDSYYSPVGTAADGDETYVFVYNPNGSAITVNYETRIGSGSFVVAAGGAYRYLMPPQSGAHFFTDDGSTFFAIATVGAAPGANLVHDWGFSLLPENYLTPIAVVGWGPGSDDLTENGSPVWVTAAAATTVYVDYDGDPTTGPLTDANGDQYDVALNLSMLESARVYDNSDNDQTGMKLYTLDGILITAAWGQDPANSLGGAPYLDLGTTVLPFPIASVEKTSAIVVDENSNGLIDWGDTLEYTIVVNNDGVIVLGGVVAFDWLPTGTDYVLGSTTLNGAPVADDTVPPAATEFPLDEGGLAIPAIPPTDFSIITFRVTVNPGTTNITNSVSINTDQEELNTEDNIDVNTPDVTACSLEFSDDGGVSQATYLENSDIYVTVDDNDRNTDAGTAQSFTVVVNCDNGDVETITLIETGNDTGVFRNTAALPLSLTSGLSHEDGTLYGVAGNTVQVAYTDPVFGDTCSDTAGIVIPTEIKPLYLSEPGQGMDRVDPEFTGDSTTATSVMLLASSSETTGMAVWSAAGIPGYNAWDGSSFTTTLGAITQTDRWRIMAGAAAPTRDEKIVVGIENSSNEISGELWNGSSWSKTSLTALADVSQSYWWGADVAYEQQSGDAVLVWTGGTTYANQLRYQVWNGTSWTAPANIAAYTGSTPMQMQLAANPNSDEMVLVVNDSNENDYALVWDGSSWGNLQLLASSTTDDRTDIFVAYEQQSGRAMVVYGNGTSSVYYRIWNGSIWTGANSVAPPSGVDGYARWTTQGSDPNSNRIVMGVTTSGSDPWLSVWNGTSWDASVLASALNSTPTTTAPNIAVAFESSSGQAMAVSGSSDNKMIYKTWTSGTGWSGATTHPFVVTSGSNSMMLYADPNLDQLMYVVQDGGQDINYIHWDGSSWGTATELETASGETKNQPFVFLYDQHIVPTGSSTTFTQSPVMCDDFFLPTGGAVGVSTYVNVTQSVSGNVSIDAVSDGTTEGLSVTIPHTTSGTNRLMLVGVSMAPKEVGYNVSTITYNGVDLSVVGTREQSDKSRIEIWRLLAPDLGTHNVVVTLSNSGHEGVAVGVMTFNNVDQSTPLGTFASAVGDSDSPSVNVSSAAGELVFDTLVLENDGDMSISPGSGQTERWDLDVNKINAGGSTKPGAASVSMSWSWVVGAKKWALGAVPVKPVSSSGGMPANPDISATIKHDGTTIKTLTNPTVTDLGSDIYRLDWADVISSDTTVLAGEQFELEVANNEAGLGFEILYDSITRPSKILLPTTTVIVIDVDTLAAYDAPYPGGSPVTDAQNGAILYLRATVSDPFGTDDITDLDLSIIDPCGGAPISVTLDDGDVVATAGCSKTYEYVWNTSTCQGNYDIIAIANEGTEGITDREAIRVTLSYTDTGTASFTGFTDGSGNPVNDYDPDAAVCVQVTDMDQNSNPGVPETLTAVVTSSQGDSETMTLTETGPNTGIFRACITSSTTPPAVPEDGSLHALPGDVLVANYTDPDDASDTSDDTALVNTVAAEMSVFKLLVDPVDGTAVVNDLIRFDIVVGNPGPTNLTTLTVTDTFDAGCMSFDAASIAPNDPGVNPLTWDESELGTLSVDSSVTIAVWFRADAACDPATNSVSANGEDPSGTSVSAGPAAAEVTITEPALSVTKTLISPNPGPAYVGDPVTFRITLQNTGTSVITTLPLADTFSDVCYDYQTATIGPDGVGAGSLLWNNLGPLATSASTSLDVTLTVTGECNPAQNTADVSFAVDENGDNVPAVQDSTGLQTIGATIGDRVWNDRDGDGVQDVNEGGIANVIVFVDLNGDGSRDPGESYDTTDVNGAYDITDLAAGTYNIQVDAATMPAGVVLTGGSNPLSVTVAAGGDFNTADFGYQGNASIGDFIWNDTDGDGNQDGGESGIGSVTVFLDVDDDGVRDAGEPYVITDGSGIYDFVNLAAGDYVVDVDDTTLPAGFTLTTGFHTLSVSLADGEDFNDADFGYQPPGTVTGHLFIDVNSNGVQDASEVGLVGVDIDITDSNMNPVTVTTDANGDYQASIPPGSTTLDVDNTTLPPGAVLTTANDPQVVTVNSGAAIASAAVGYHVPGPYLYQAHYRWRNDDGGETGGSGGGSLRIDTIVSDQADGTNTLTLSNVNVPSDASDSILVVVAAMEHDAEGVRPLPATVTWGPDNLSNAVEHYVDDGGNGYSCSVAIWILRRPALDQTRDVTITFSSTALRTSGSAFIIENVADLDTEATAVNDAQDNTTTNTNITTVSPDAFIIDAFVSGTTTGMTTTQAGQTERIDNLGTSHRHGISDKQGPGTPGVTTLGWDHGGNNRQVAVVAAFSTQLGPGATFTAGEDVKLIGLAKEDPQRLRFMVSNEGAGGSGGVNYQLYVAQTTDPTGAACPTETYQAIDDGGQTHWEMVDTGVNITDGQSTVNIDPGLTDEATTFVPGELKDSNDTTTGSIALNVDEFTEIEFSIQATLAAPDAGEYCFKLVKDGSPDTDLDAYAIYAQVNLAGATAVDLLSFEAMGEGSNVKVAWQTANEINNMGFYLYRADTKDGPFSLLSDKLIPGADFTTLGQAYAYIDRDVTRGRIYYYRLVDVDTSGTRTDHGPICVDWDGDGLPDDWEIAHGLDPTVNDADLDADNDGLTNLEEYERGSDPNNPDSNGNGILDGDEHFQYGPSDPGGSLSLSRGVHVLASDETGITLELRTAAFETATIQVDDEQFEKLSIKEYVHGYSAEVGKPQLPLKGILLDIPEGQSAHLSVLDTASTIGYGYQVYPVPQNYAEDQSYTVQVAELFTMDADAYGQDAFYPASVAGLGEVYNFRDQLKQQLIFYPLSFNPASGQIRHYSRIRVRIDYEDADLAKASKAGPQPWVPPSGSKLLPNPLSMGPTAMAFIGPAFLNSPIISAIASLGTLAQSLWMPPGFDWTTQGPAYKILVADPGLYRLTGSYLAASGVDLTGVNIGQVRLYNLGAEIALTVYDENGNNGFDDSDYIEFYATAVDSEYAKYTNHNVYWLTLAGGLGTPMRMGVVDGTPAAGPDSAVHYFTVHYEPDDGYWQEAPGVDSLDRWFIGAIALGDQIQSANAGQPVSFNLPLVDVVDSATGTLKIMLYGGYDTDHEVLVSYEGQELGTFAWSGYTSYEVVIEDVNFSEQIGDGNYTVSVTCLSGFDRIAFDWIAATYPREFLANDDSLTFTHDAGYLFAIDDFSTDELMVLDISAADDPVRVEGFDIYEPVASSFSLEFETADDGQTHTYLVLAEARVNTSAAAVVEDSASDLGDSANGADYILITHDDIGWDGSGQPRPWVDDLVTLREAQGLRVKVVNVQDIYDEFSYGLVTPQAIKDFLTYAYENWTGPAPEYVLLVGDSSYDYKDNWKLGTINHVPSYLTYTEFMGETVTDEWFVTVNGDDAAADMYIGRLPAETATEAQVMVDKIIAYETEPNTKTWEKNILLVADDQEEAFESVFKTMNEDAAALLPAAMNPAYKGYLQDYLDAGFSPLDLNSDIVDKINAGALIANFSGHGHLQGWASESIFAADDIDSLTNVGKYPFIVSMNCLTGYFAYPDPDPLAVSFAELLLRAELKGAAAALMPTGMTTTEGQHVMNTALFETIFVEDVRKLGPAIARAKRVLLANGDAYFEQVSQTFLLFGDPAMQLRVPLPRRPAGLAPAIWTKTGVALGWAEALDCNNDPVAGYNVYRSTSPTGNFTKINQAAITEPEFTDDTASAAASAIYYYTVTAVDVDGDESIPSAMVASPSLAAGKGIVSGGSGGGGGGCFVSAAATSFKLADIRTAAICWVLMVCGVLALLRYFLKNALDSPSTLLRGMTN